MLGGAALELDPRGDLDRERALELGRRVERRERAPRLGVAAAQAVDGAPTKKDKGIVFGGEDDLMMAGNMNRVSLEEGTVEATSWKFGMLNFA